VSVECGLSEPPVFTEEVQNQLLSYRWPGNVRELKNVIERAVYRSKGEIISSIQLDPFVNPFANPCLEPTQAETTTPAPVTSTTKAQTIASFYDNIPINKLNETKEALEKNLLERALKQTNGNQKEAAVLMNLSYDQFRGLYRKHNR
jgi:psp operon transcriptional activator